MKTFGRVITAMVTAFNQDGSVNIDGTIQIANQLLDNGSDGILICGTTGENPTISPEDKLTLFKAVAEACASKGTLIANVGSNNTRASVEFVKKVCSIPGISGLLAVVPYYNKPNAEGQYLHYKALAEASSLPILIYNIPGRTGKAMDVATMKRLNQEFPNTIVGVKEASGSLDNVAKIRYELPTDFMIYSGDDGLTLPILSLGGVGVISVVSHLVGKDMNAMIQAFQSGNVKGAEEINRSLYDLCKVMFITTNPIPVKYACRQMGWPVGPFNLPMCEPSDAEADMINAALKAHNIL